MSEDRMPLCGFINVLKPPGMSSAQVVGYVRWLLNGAKVGHGGTLDPEAAGVLPLMVGKAARLFDYMQEKEKGYIAEVAFGAATDTQDAQGTVTARSEHYPKEEEIRAVLPRFTGALLQRPPMYSALKLDGKRLYQMARNGESAEIPQREVNVFSLKLHQTTEKHGALLEVRCSKGFYVRTLCQDLGEALGCPAHMRFLLRIQSGIFTLSNAVTLESLAQAKEEGCLEKLILGPEIALSHLPQAQTPERLEKALRNGGELPLSAFPDLKSLPQDGFACLWLKEQLMGVARRENNGLRLRTWIGE